MNKLQPLIDWVYHKVLPDPAALAQISSMTFDKICHCKHPDDITQDAQAVAIAIRIRYLSTRREVAPGSDQAEIDADMAKIDWMNDRFMTDRLAGLESVLIQMDTLIDT